MESRRFFEMSPDESGIVIVFPSGVKSLFNPYVHRLVRKVEDHLNGVFVTYALSGGAVPDVDSALKAARFAGCSSAVVIHSDEWLGDGVGFDSSTDTLWNEIHLEADLHDTAERVAAAYTLALPSSGMAA